MRRERFIAVILLVALIVGGCGASVLWIDYGTRGQSDEQYTLDRQKCERFAQMSRLEPGPLEITSMAYPQVRHIEPPYLRLYAGCMIHAGYMLLFAPRGHSEDQVKTDKQDCQSQAKKAYIDCMQDRGYSLVRPAETLPSPGK